MKELKLRVESLSVYRLLVDEAPDVILVISPDVDARVLFANEASARLLQAQPASLAERSLWELLHPGDKPAVLKVLSDAILAKGTLGKVDCLIRAPPPPQPLQPPLQPPQGQPQKQEQGQGQEQEQDGYLRVGVSMRYAPQGILAFVRPSVE